MNKIKELIKSHNFIISVILIFMVFVFTLVNDNFIKPYNLLSMTQTLVPYAILTLGILFVIGSGNTDLSMGSVCIASCVISGKLYMMGMALPLVIPVTIIIGLCFGLLNGWLVAKMRLPSFIATLGTMMFSRGISSILVGDPNIFFPSNTWYNKLFSNYNGFPIGILWLIAFIIVVYILINKTKIGRYVLAIGSNPEAARLSGVRTRLYVYIAYVISGIAAGIAGIFWSSSFATVASATGNGMEFDAMAAAYIGGTSASGGSVSVVGSMIGMVTLIVIKSGLNFVLSRYNINVNSTYVTYAVTGIIIVASLLIDIQSKKEKKIKDKKPNNKKVMFGILSLVVVFGVIGGILFLNNKEEKKVVAVISKNETSSFWKSVKQGCEEACEDYGYELSFRGPENESPSFLPQALSLAKIQLSNNPTAIGMCSICEGFTDILTQAYDNNIPIIEYDSGVYDADKEAAESIGKNPVLSSVKTDSYEASKMAGQKAYELVREDIINSEETYLIGAIQHDESKSAKDRATGFVDGFMEMAEADPETSGKCDYRIEVKPDNLNNNYKIALESLAERGTRVVFQSCLYVVEQCYDAIQASNGRYDEIKFVAFDTGTKIIEWMKNNKGPKLLGAIAQDSRLMGYKVVECAINAANGETDIEDISIDGIWYDSDNIDEMIEKGIVFEG